MATVEMDPNTVVAACDQTLAVIEKERKTLLEEAIDKEMRGWFGLGWFAPANREEALQRLKHDRDYIISTYEFIMLHCSKQEKKVRELKQAALAASRDHKLITLSTADFSALNGRL